MKRLICVAYILLMSVFFMSGCGTSQNDGGQNSNNEGSQSTAVEGGTSSQAKKRDEPYVVFTIEDSDGDLKYFNYDENGNKVASYTFNNDGTIEDEMSLWLYNESGKCTYEAECYVGQYDVSNNTIIPGRIINETEYVYGKDGSLTSSSSSSNRNGSTTNMKYNGEGRIVYEEYDSGDQRKENTFSYDEYGNEIKNEMIEYYKGDKKGAVSYYHEYEYDSHGEILSDNYYMEVSADSVVAPGSKGTQYNKKFSYEYDEDKLLKKTDVMNGDYTVYRYDSYGNIVFKDTYTNLGNLSSSDSYTYDESGKNLIKSVENNEITIYAPLSDALTNQKVSVKMSNAEQNGS